MTRKYSVAEIDGMRESVLAMQPYGSSAAARIATAEDQLRTYMLAGTEPDDLVELGRLGAEKYQAGALVAWAAAADHLTRETSQRLKDRELMFQSAANAVVVDVAHDTRSPLSRFVNWFARPWYGHRASRDGMQR